MMIFLYTMCDMGWVLPWLLPFLIGIVLGWSLWGKWKSKYQELMKDKSSYKAKLAKLNTEYKDEKRLKNKYKKDFENCEAKRSEEKKLAISHGTSNLDDTAIKKYKVKDKGKGKSSEKSDQSDLNMLKKELKDSNRNMQKMQEELNKAMNELIDLKSISMNVGDKNALEEARKKAEDLERQLERVKNEKRHLETVNQELRSHEDQKDDSFPILEIYSRDKDDSNWYDELVEDDLQIFEGIGPEIEKILRAAGIRTWQDLATHKEEDLASILARKEYVVDNNHIGNWITQASFAVNGDWDELVEFQKNLSGSDKFSTSLTNSKLHKLKLSIDERLRRFSKSDFVVIDGMDRNIANLLVQSGMKSLVDLAKAPIDTIKILLQISGVEYSDSEISTWKRQAELIVDKDWIELDKYQKSIRKD